MRQFATFPAPPQHEWTEPTRRVLQATRETYAMGEANALRASAAEREAAATRKSRLARMVSGQEVDALEFLRREPLRNVTLIGSISAHGLESAHHRGVFYAHTGEGGHIDALALVGHWVLMSNAGTRAVEAFAGIARAEHGDKVEVVLGEEFAVELFNRLFTAPPSQRSIRRSVSQSLFTIQEIEEEEERETLQLRLAQTEEVEEVEVAHARACLEIHGFDKQACDPPGFRRRLLSRLELGRIWIVRDGQGVAFKCDMVMTTDEAFYLEGIWTRPDLRGRGFTTRVMKLLCRKLLQERAAICLFADASDRRATSFYHRVGFENIAPYHLTWYNSVLDESVGKMQ